MVSLGNSIQHNKISLASLDMQSYEAIDRSLSNLSMLDETLSYVHNRFENLTEQQRSRISQYVARLNMCQRKIAALQEVKKVIVFTSPAQFVQKYSFSQETVKPSMLKDYKQKHNPQRFDPATAFNMYNENADNGPLLDTSRAEDQYQTFQLSYGKFTTREKNPFGNRKLPLKERKEGLGNLGKRRLRCAESLLVLNTNMNPYKKYQQVDNLALEENKEPQRVKATEEGQINLQEAPVGIKQMLSEYQPTEYTYNPRSKEVENSVPLPMTLGLDGIAEDYISDYSTSQLVQTAANLRQRQTAQDPYANRQQNSSATTTASTAASAPVAAPSPAPVAQQQQQQPQQQQQQQQARQAQQSAPVVSAAPTAPVIPGVNAPAPPAPNLPLPQAQTQPVQQAPPAEPAPTRNAFLDEIQNPKVKLRKTVTVVKGGLNQGGQKGDDNKPIPKTSVGIDPMEQFKQAIRDRYKGMNPTSKKQGKARNVVGEKDTESEHSGSGED